MSLNETYSKVCIIKHLSDAFHVQNGLEQGDTLLALFFTLLYNTPLRRPKRIREIGIKWDTQLLVCADQIKT
jgi:hypothetical protein